MIRRHGFRLRAVLLALLTVVSASAAGAAKKPNVLFIPVDGSSHARRIDFAGEDTAVAKIVDLGDGSVLIGVDAHVKQVDSVLRPDHHDEWMPDQMDFGCRL